MRSRLCVVLLAFGMIISQLPGAVVFADGTETPDKPAASFSGEADSTETPDEPAAEPAPAETEEAEVSDAVSKPVPEEPSESKPIEAADSEISLESREALKAGTKDVYIDNTVDNSMSYVTATVHITGSGGKQAGYDKEKTVYENKAAVTYSNPKTSQVQGMINDAETKAYNTANDIKKRGKTGEFHMATAQSTGKVWDHRKYTTVEDNDAVLIGDSDYLSGAYGVNEDYTRTHIASGDYGKETFFEVQVDGWFSGWSITVTDDGNGTAAADLEESLAEETVSLTATPDKGYRFKEWQVISGGAELSDTSAASATFKMPYADVEIKAVFEAEHTHTLVKTDKVEASCVKAGTEAYWTCSECGMMFSDEAGTKEISEPVSIAATGHDWGDWEIVEEPTETEPGQRVRVCMNDPDHVQVESIPPLEEPDSDISGEGSESESGSSTGSGSGSANSSPKTADENHLGMWAAVFAACLATLAAAMRKRRA